MFNDVVKRPVTSAEKKTIVIFNCEQLTNTQNFILFVNFAQILLSNISKD